MRARTVRWVAGCTAAGSVMLIGGGVALAYADRHLVPASVTGWTVSNISGQAVNAAVPVAAFVLASRRPENRIGWLFLAAGLALGLSGFSDQYALHALVAAPGSWPAGRAAGWLFNVVWMIPCLLCAFSHNFGPPAKPVMACGVRSQRALLRVSGRVRYVAVTGSEPG